MKRLKNSRQQAQNSFSSCRGYFVYILQSRDGRYYTGYTTDLERRLKEHQSGEGSKFTRSFGAVEILYHEVFSEKSQALKREIQIKSWSRAQKKALINDQKNNLKNLAISHKSTR